MVTLFDRGCICGTGVVGGSGRFVMVGCLYKNKMWTRMVRVDAEC